MHRFELLNKVAERQEWVVATWQAALVGASPQELFTRAEEHAWERWHWGVIGTPGPRSPKRLAWAAILAYSRPHSARDIVRTDAGITVLVDTLVAAALRGGQLLWGPSALWAYGLIPAPRDIWIRLPRMSGHEARDGVKLRFGELPRSCTTLADGLPVPVLEQALVEYAAWCGTDRVRCSKLLDVICDADAKRMTTLDKIDEYLASIGPVAGKRVLTKASGELRGTLSHSRTEAKARRIIVQVAKAYGLTVSKRPETIRQNGIPVGEADVAVQEITLDIQIDGPHHRMSKQRSKDVVRDRKVRRVGWDVERFPTELVKHDPERFRKEIDACIRARLEALGRRATSQIFENVV